MELGLALQKLVFTKITKICIYSEPDWSFFSVLIQLLHNKEEKSSLVIVFVSGFRRNYSLLPTNKPVNSLT